MTKMMERYLHNLRVRNFSESSIDKHVRGLRRFSDYLSSVGITDLKDVSRKTVGDYQDHLFTLINRKGQVNSPTTRNQDLGVVKSFFHYLHVNDLLPADPAALISYARTDKPLPRIILNHGQMKRLINAPDDSTVLGCRDAAILHLFYSCALRKGEVENLLLSNLDTVNGWLRVNKTKNGTDRIIPVGKVACRHLDLYLRDSRPHLVHDPAEQHLFVSRTGIQLERSTMRVIVKRHAIRAKLKTPVTPHALRHSAATALVRGRANLRHVQELLGHKQITSTQVYTRTAPQDLKEALERHHPMERQSAYDDAQMQQRALQIDGDAAKEVVENAAFVDDETRSAGQENLGSGDHERVLFRKHSLAKSL